MLRRYAMIINVLLIAVSLFLLNKILRVWGTDEYPNSVAVKKENATNLPALNVSFAPRKPRYAYQEIVDKDLFRPERTEWKSPTQEGESSASRVPPKILVYGIVITQASRYAWIQEQDKANKVIKISEGGEISGWKLTTIESTAIQLKNGDQTLTVNLIEPGKPKIRLIPKPAIRPRPKKSTQPSSDTQSRPAPTPAPEQAPVPPPPPLPEKK